MDSPSASPQHSSSAESNTDLTSMRSPSTFSSSTNDRLSSSFRAIDSHSSTLTNYRIHTDDSSARRYDGMDLTALESTRFCEEDSTILETHRGTRPQHVVRSDMAWPNERDEPSSTPDPNYRHDSRTSASSSPLPVINSPTRHDDLENILLIYQTSSTQVNRTLSLKEFNALKKILRANETELAGPSSCAICLEPFASLVSRLQPETPWKFVLSFLRKACCCETQDLAQYRSAQNEELQLPCAHRFHETCIRVWLTESKRTCPLCMADVISEQSDGPIRERRIRFQLPNAINRALESMDEETGILSWDR